MSRVVISPAGENIEILPDEEWPKGDWKELRKPLSASLAIFKALWNHGSFTSSDGKATGDLAKEAQKYGYSATEYRNINGVLRADLNILAIEREIRGKRCYKISLVALPEKYLGYVVDEDKQVTSEPELESGFEIPVVEEKWDDSLAPEVARNLLNQVVDIIMAGKPEVMEARVKQLNSNLDEVLVKLNEQGQYNQALRKENASIKEQLGAVIHERDGLRRRLRMAEDNVQKALRGDVAQHVDEQIRKEVAKIMEAKPQPGKGGINSE